MLALGIGVELATARSERAERAEKSASRLMCAGQSKQQGGDVGRAWRTRKRQRATRWPGQASPP